MGFSFDPRPRSSFPPRSHNVSKNPYCPSSQCFSNFLCESFLFWRELNLTIFIWNGLVLIIVVVWNLNFFPFNDVRIFIISIP